MADIFNEDFRDFIQALNDNAVEYMLVGDYAVILYGYRRPTGDMDIWIHRTLENYKKLVSAFNAFGMPVFDMTENNFLRNEEFDVFTFGTSPVSIDIITKLKGVDFVDAYKKINTFNDNGLEVKFIHINQLIEAKKASGRHKDLDDIEKMTFHKDDE